MSPTADELKPAEQRANAIASIESDAKDAAQYVSSGILTLGECQRAWMMAIRHELFEGEPDD